MTRELPAFCLVCLLAGLRDAAGQQFQLPAAQPPVQQPVDPGAPQPGAGQGGCPARRRTLHWPSSSADGPTARRWLATG